MVEGIAYATTQGARGVCIVPADAPRISVADIDVLVTQHTVCTVVPDHACVGTNALVLTPPDVMAPIFDGASFQPHLHAAVAAGLPVRALASASLGLDIDTPADLRSLQASNGAPVTRAYLARLAQLT